MCQRHMLCHDLASSSGAQPGIAALDELIDWVISTGCANHDTQNGLKWGLAWLTSGDDVIKKLYIAIESLRNAYDLLHKYLPKFLIQSLLPVDDDLISS